MGVFPPVHCRLVSAEVVQCYNAVGGCGFWKKSTTRYSDMGAVQWMRRRRYTPSPEILRVLLL